MPKTVQSLSAGNILVQRVLEAVLEQEPIKGMEESAALDLMMEVIFPGEDASDTGDDLWAVLTNEYAKTRGDTNIDVVLLARMMASIRDQHHY